MELYRESLRSSEPQPENSTRRLLLIARIAGDDPVTRHSPYQQAPVAALASAHQTKQHHQHRRGCERSDASLIQPLAETTDQRFGVLKTYKCLQRKESAYDDPLALHMRIRNALCCAWSAA